MSQIEIDTEPNDVLITTNEKLFCEHEIVNFSPFDVVCRIRATNSKLFSVNKNAFYIKSKEKFRLLVSRAPYQARSHHLKIDVTKTTFFQPQNLLDYFVGPYHYKTFIIRYHGPPRYWFDALEMNSWITPEHLNKECVAGLKNASKEKKSSYESSEISYVNDQQDTEENNLTDLANMNTANVLFMSMQTTDEVKKDAKDTGSSDESDLDETNEN